ncbi:MAG TPA: copper resistance protein NlpE [Cyclobacteriaceae bacterium]|mgnify:CR=1 FL=1|nr:copper resistance protein NlpE [Cyclobacteriaceae bacterium]
MKLKAIICILIAVFNFSCAVQPKQEEQASSAIDMHTSEIALDWMGTYTGTIPCADCEGIEIHISLATDKTFTLHMNYLGKSADVFEYSGTFRWNAAGNTIIIPIVDTNQQYFVGENYLIYLDQDGERISGELADEYFLRKQ